MVSHVIRPGLTGRYAITTEELSKTYGISVAEVVRGLMDEAWGSDLERLPPEIRQRVLERLNPQVSSRLPQQQNWQAVRTIPQPTALPAQQGLPKEFPDDADEIFKGGA